MTGILGSARLCAAMLLVAGLAPAVAQAQGQTRGDASLRLEYQYIETGNFFDENFTFDYWNTKTHVLMLSGDYALSERWSVYASLPYVKKRFIPDDPWGKPYVYVEPSEHRIDFDIHSLGPDKREGTEDDIGNWMDPRKITSRKTA